MQSIQLHRNSRFAEYGFGELFTALNTASPESSLCLIWRRFAKYGLAEVQQRKSVQFLTELARLNTSCEHSSFTLGYHREQSTVAQHFADQNRLQHNELVDHNRLRHFGLADHSIFGTSASPTITSLALRPRRRKPPSALSLWMIPAIVGPCMLDKSQP